MQKTLGGDRLGAGKKMKVDLHGYERSTHDLSRVWRSTMAAGTLVPFLSELALPGDTWDINLNMDGKTHPTIGPLFGSYKAQLDIFLCPIRLYNALLHNNMLGIGLKIDQVKFPLIGFVSNQFTGTANEIANIDTIHVNPSCIMHYLGVKGFGLNTSVPTGEFRYFNAIPLLCYWEIYKNYYANKQEEIGAVIHTPAVAIVNTVQLVSVNSGNLGTVNTPSAVVGIQGVQVDIQYLTTPPNLDQIILGTQELGERPLKTLWTGFTDDGISIISGIQGANIVLTYTYWRYIEGTDINTGRPSIATFPLENIDQMRTDILSFTTLGAPFIVNQAPSAPLDPYGWIYEIANSVPNTLSSQEGLGLKTYQSDLFNNWLQTEWIDGTNGVNTITRVDTSAGYLQLDALNIAKKVYDYLNRVAVSGGSYQDWLDVTYDTQRYSHAESPMYMGGLSKELIFQEVVSNAASTDDPLGTLAGKGVMASKHKGGNVTIKVDEPSYIIGIVSLTPRIDYSQGNKWDMHLQTLDDIHKPAMDGIGFQELITEQMAWWDTKWDNTSGEWVTKSAGKQPAWINYMTAINETHGNFAIPENEMFMTLNRRYEFDDVTQQIKDLTTYIDPSKYNFIFAETALDAQNFWVQIAADITCRRKMSAKVMPNV